MRPITLLLPPRLVFGNGCIKQFASDILTLDFNRVYIVSAPQILPLYESVNAEIQDKGIDVRIDTSITREPTIELFNSVMEAARAYNPDAIVGIGGGSVLDVAKLVAALMKSDQSVSDVIGIGKLKDRKTHLICLPTTSGTGSEVSPNAILLDTEDELKKGVISPYLVPDAAYVDPELTLTIPPKITAETGIDALTHCIEAYANLNSHPIIDMFALEGVRLIGSSLKRAVDNGMNIEARTNLSLGSLYGGMCLGPVNTAAVHALSYPLGGKYHIAHGLSNALLLPHVMEFNLIEMPERYADIAIALGEHGTTESMELAKRGVEMVNELLRQCGIPTRLSELNIPRESFEEMTQSALTVTRLLKNNPRKLTKDDALAIYEKAQ
jgi:alcohol dehydrogenase